MSESKLNTICELRQKEFELTKFKPIYPDYSKEEIMLPMTDKVRLKTTIFRPVNVDKTVEAKPLPVIIERTCYTGQEKLRDINGENFAKRGYIFVSQYCRGTGGSEGEWFPNVNEREDGLATLFWLNSQNWAETIGYWGNSYLALTGWAIADRVPDKVKGMCLTHYGTDRFQSAYEKGMFRQDVLTAWAMGNAGFQVEADYIESCKFMPQLEVDEKLWGKKLDWYRDLISNDQREDSYWQQGWWKELYEITKQVKVPLYVRSGWYDHHHGSAMNTWDMLSEETKEHSWLDIGGWNHSFEPCLEDCEIKNINHSEILAVLEWFELILKKGKLPDKRIRTYVIGSDLWLEFPVWPLKNQENKSFYLTCKEDVKILQQKKDEINGKLSYQYDPQNPNDSYGVESLLQNMKANGSLVQPEPDYRQDVLSFISEPFTKDLQIIGKIKVHLYVSSSCPDTAFTAKIIEVRENKKAYSIRSGITSLCHDIGHSYEPQAIECVTIEMWDIAYQLRKGSRLRIDISSSDFPQYHVHSNYAGVWSLQDKTQKAVQTIFYGETYPSYIEIPYKRCNEME